MSLQATAAKVREGLSNVVASGGLPGNIQPKAEALLAALDKPVRLTVMGLPGTGKSQLLNLLAGADVVHSGVHLPTTQLIYGESPKSTCTMPDGTEYEFDHCEVVDIAALHPVFLKLALPLPALQRISILEVVTSDDHIDQQRAMSWASKRTDVALWCTQSFTIPEQTIWGAMPDIMKDHGFMVVTKADVLARNELLDTTLANVKAVGEHEFDQIIPVATLAALDARQPDGSVDKDALRRSGGLALITAILRQVDLGQQATIDQAAMILRQHAQVAAATPAKMNVGAQEKTIVAGALPVEPAPAPKAEAPPVAKVAPLEAAVEKPQEPVVARAKPTPKPVDDLEFPEPLQKKPKAPPPPRPTLMPESQKAYKEAIAYLVRESRALAKAVEATDNLPPAAKIMSRSVDSVQWLAEHLQDNGEDGDLLLERTRESVLDAADLIQLMQLEKQDSAVLDAVSLVLQLKHELEADLAA